MSEEKCTEGGECGWHNKPPSTDGALPLQNNVSMAKRLPAVPSPLAKKTEKLDFNPSVQSRFFLLLSIIIYNFYLIGVHFSHLHLKHTVAGSSGKKKKKM